MVTYCFDAMSRTLRVAIPRTYDDALFERESGDKKALMAEQKSRELSAHRAELPSPRDAKQLSTERVEELKKSGRKVTVVGGGLNPARKGVSIVAGTISDKKTGDVKAVAVRIDHDTTVVRPTGELLLPTFASNLSEGSVIAVNGRKSKYGVIRAKSVVVVSE